MIEKGIVLKVSVPDGIQVLLDSKQSCDGCNLCSMTGSGNMLMRLPFQENIHEGDSVVIEVPDVSLIKISLLVFILPLILFTAGILGADHVSKRLLGVPLPEIYQLISGCIMMAVTFFFLYRHNRTLQKKGNNIPRIVQTGQPQINNPPESLTP